MGAHRRCGSAAAGKSRLRRSGLLVFFLALAAGLAVFWFARYRVEPPATSPPVTMAPAPPPAIRRPGDPGTASVVKSAVTPAKTARAIRTNAGASRTGGVASQPVPAAEEKLAAAEKALPPASFPGGRVMPGGGKRAGNKPVTTPVVRPAARRVKPAGPPVPAVSEGRAEETAPKNDTPPEKILPAHRDVPVMDADNMGLEVQALVWAEAPADRMAVVNGEILRTGGMVGDVVISYIGGEYIIIRKDGKRGRVEFELK